MLWEYSSKEGYLEDFLKCIFEGSFLLTNDIRIIIIGQREAKG